MELVEGETLTERVATGPIPLDEAIPLFIEIAEGLEAAHEKGIVHRDLKPANIKIGPDGKPKILDFGLAKAFASNAQAPGLSESPTVARGTAVGVILGTAPYMSPEQARGKTVDKRTDVWAFRCCLYEALTGGRPQLDRGAKSARSDRERGLTLDLTQRKEPIATDNVHSVNIVNVTDVNVNKGRIGRSSSTDFETYRSNRSCKKLRPCTENVGPVG